MVTPSAQSATQGASQTPKSAKKPNVQKEAQGTASKYADDAAEEESNESGGDQDE